MRQNPFWLMTSSELFVLNSALNPKKTFYENVQNGIRNEIKRETSLIHTRVRLSYDVTKRVHDIETRSHFTCTSHVDTLPLRTRAWAVIPSLSSDKAICRCSLPIY